MTEKKLNEYLPFVIHGADGMRGDCFEAALHDFYEGVPYVSPIGVVDIKIKISAAKVGNKVEVKSGAGTIKNNLRGNSYVIYCPIVNLDLPLSRQEAFAIPRKQFIEILIKAKCYRAVKKTTSNSKTEAIQTFWIHSKNKPNGRKYDLLMDEIYNLEPMTLKELLELKD